MVGKLRLVDAIGGPADQHEPPVAIAAIDIPLFVDLQEHARVAESGAAGNVGRAVASDAGVGDSDGFGRRQHGWGDSKAVRGLQSLTGLPFAGRGRTIAGMIALSRFLPLALFAATPTLAQTVSKPAPAKPAAAKPKPASAKAKPAAKARPKTPLMAISPLSHDEKDGFSVLQVAVPDAAKFIAAWKLGTGGDTATTRTVANRPLFTLLIIRGCKPNPDGKCDVVADFLIHRPDGTINDDNKGVAVWDKAAPADPKKPYIGDGALGYGVDDEGPFGDYRIVATVTDRVAGVSVTTEETLTIAPAPGAKPAKPAEPAPADPAKPDSAAPDPSAK